VTTAALPSQAAEPIRLTLLCAEFSDSRFLFRLEDGKGTPQVPIARMSPCAYEVLCEGIERDVPAAIAIIHSVPGPDFLEGQRNLDEGHKLHRRHFCDVLALKELTGDHASIAAVIRGTNQMVCAYRDVESGGWVIACHPAEAHFEWLPGDQFVVCEG
jgi:hypothetical protein